jgi:hypothetical protein
VHPAPSDFVTNPDNPQKIKYETIFSKNGYGIHHTPKFMYFFRNATM